MTGGREEFVEINNENLPRKYVIYADNSKGKVNGIGNVAISEHHSLSNVMLVDQICYSLVSVSQLCDTSMKVCFYPDEVIASKLSDDSQVFKNHRSRKLYIVNFKEQPAAAPWCLMAKTGVGWLWHRLLGHVGMKLLNKLSKHDYVKGLEKVKLRKTSPAVHVKPAKKLELPIVRRLS